MRTLAIGLLVILAVLVSSSGFLFDSKLKITSFFNSLPEESDLQKQLAELKKENENLKTQLFVQSIKKEKTIKVYSAHPFNNRGEIAIAAGEDKEIKLGNIVTYGNNILVGKVTKVFKASSIITTIFDPSWKMAVRIGQGEIDALMQGGNELTLTLIPQEANVREGDQVIAASPDFPYGLGVGYVKSVRGAGGGAFKEATLEPSFQLSQLRDVTVYR